MLYIDTACDKRLIIGEMRTHSMSRTIQFDEQSARLQLCIQMSCMQQWVTMASIRNEATCDFNKMLSCLQQMFGAQEGGLC